MDITLKQKLKEYRLILASNSPRRQQLFQDVGLEFKVRVRETSEALSDNLSVEDQVMALAIEKAEAQNEVMANHDLIVTADTIVVQNNTILGKPKHREEANTFLKAYSGNSHRVLTGVCIKTKDRQYAFYEETRVYFNLINDDVIQDYLNQNTFQDKAGAYGIQDSIGKWSISKIDGCYYNVMGFPMASFITQLTGFLPHE